MTETTSTGTTRRAGEPRRALGSRGPATCQNQHSLPLHADALRAAQTPASAHSSACPATSAQVLPHWQEHVSRQYPQVGRRFQPPGELHSPFYPLRGPYSSADQQLLVEQFQEMKAAGESGVGRVGKGMGGMLQVSLGDGKLL